MTESSTHLMEAISRFTGKDVDDFRDSWNQHVTPKEPSISDDKIPDRTETEPTVDKPALKEIQKHLESPSKNILASGLSIGVSVEYTSFSGNKQNRDIIIRRLFKNGNDVFIDAYCLMLQAPRLIRLNSISKITDKKTGKVYTDALSFLENILAVDTQKEDVEETAPTPYAAPLPRPTTLQSPSAAKGELKTAIARSRYEVTALLFVSSIDGRRDKVELQKIADYVHRRCPDLTFNDADLFEYIGLIEPDAQSFYLALERIIGKDGWIVKMFLESLMGLIMADGEASEKEKLFLADFLSVLQEEGFELEFLNK